MGVKLLPGKLSHYVFVLVGVLTRVMIAQQTDDFRSYPPPQCMTQSLPPQTLEWQSSVTGSTVQIEWGYDEGVCSSWTSCFGADSGQSEDSLVPQLMPVQIQPGMNVQFFASRHADVPLTLQPFRVSEAAFRSCDFSNATPVVTESTDQVITVPQSMLQPGPNYFIGETSDRLTQCRFGLRLNVTVKTAECVGPGAESTLCTDRGRCTAHLIDPSFTCQCCRGYTGEFCYDVDGCAEQPCKNGGVCTDETAPDSDNNFTCTCPMGFHGPLCEEEVEDLCSHMPCVNNGTCVGTRTEYECHCPPGYTGHHCEVDTNECQTAPCKHGVCVDKVGAYQCYCTPGYGGHNCDRLYNACEVNPCLNGGYCKALDGEYECHCTAGYEGQDCSVKVDLCNPSPCVNASECVDYGHIMFCQCHQGFTGYHCEVNINECESSPCQNGAKCHDGVAGYSCLCPPGVSGIHCEYSRNQPPTTRDESGPESDSVLHHLSITAATLGGALLLTLLVMAGCYCRVHQTYRMFLPERNGGYKRHRNGKYSTEADDLKEPRRISPDSIMAARSSHHEDNTSLAASLKPRRV